MTSVVVGSVCEERVGLAVRSDRSGEGVGGPVRHFGRLWEPSVVAVSRAVVRPAEPCTRARESSFGSIESRYRKQRQAGAGDHEIKEIGKSRQEPAPCIS